VQRRDFARVSHLAPLRVCHRGVWLEALMVDLSEGGMSFALADSRGIDDGTRLVVEVTVGGAELQLAAAVVRIGDVPSGEVAVAVRFTGLTPRIEDQIRREVFALQAQQRARGVA
jgi:c-di-GMP-binding flagellar brake protein YcgR